MGSLRVRTITLAALAALAACTTLVACNTEPSPGKVTIDFPSTEAAIATDYVQLYVFEITAAERETFCDAAVSARKGGETLEASDTPRAWNVCELLEGRPPIEIEYGEKAILAVAQRSAGNLLEDFMIGCAAAKVGEGNLPVPILLHAIDETKPLPPTSCTTVSDFCGRRCE